MGEVTGQRTEQDLWILRFDNDILEKSGQVWVVLCVYDTREACEEQIVATFFKRK